jgi:hypothetical protein
MPNKKQFYEYIKVKNIREGLWVDGKMLTVYLDLVVGPFTFKGASYKWATGSIRLNAGKWIQLKPSFQPTLKKIIVEAIDKYRKHTVSLKKSEVTDGASE